MTRNRRHLITAIILIAVSAPPLRADTLTDAYNALRAQDYALARSKVIAYYAAGGARRYRADFIRAASECRITKGSPPALGRMKALRTDYLLTAAADAEVTKWIASCVPPPPPPMASNNGVGVKVSGLGSPPPVDSAAVGPEPRPLPRMSPIIPRTGYIGDDYARPIAQSKEACQRLCQVQAQCRSMTYDLNTKICWLKRSVPTAGHGDNFVASYKYAN